MTVLDRVAADSGSRGGSLITPPVRVEGQLTWRTLLGTPAVYGLLAVWIFQVWASRATASIAFAFDDEGLYVFMGHRMLQHLTEGVFVQEFPGSYFSGAPAVYPVLAALVDSVGGLQAVRDLSLVFAMVSALALFGIGWALFGSWAGLVAAATFAAAGPTIYQSQWATFDAMMLTVVLLACWLGVVSARRTALTWSPLVAALLCLAFLTKYAALAYLPVALALTALAGWPRWRWCIVRATAFTGVATVVLGYFLVILWGRDIVPGIVQTTTNRSLISPAPADVLVRYSWAVLGPWFVLAAVASLVALLSDRRNLLIVAVLGAGAIAAPLQHLRIGEHTSLGKHLGFSAAFAALLIGYLIWQLGRRFHLVIGAVALALTLSVLVPHGLTQASQLRTGYADGAELEKVLRRAIANNPNEPVLGEEPSAQRYALRDVVAPNHWADTYSFDYAGKHNEPAYAQAIRNHYFGVIYLSFSTEQADNIVANLGAAQGADHYYHLTGRVPRYIRGERIGWWLIWTPQTELLTDMGDALDPKP